PVDSPRRRIQFVSGSESLSLRALFEKLLVNCRRLAIHRSVRWPIGGHRDDATDFSAQIHTCHCPNPQDLRKADCPDRVRHAIAAPAETAVPPRRLELGGRVRSAPPRQPRGKTCRLTSVSVSVSMNTSITTGIGKSLLLTWLASSAWVCAAQVQPLAGTAPLTMEGDIASNLVAGADQFLLRKLDDSVAARAQFWRRDFSSAQAYEQSLATNQQRLAHILGVRDQRVSQVELELIAAPVERALFGRGKDYEVFAARWPAFGDVTGEGLLLTPVNRAPVANVVAMPDADQTPEQLAGLTSGIAPESQFARRLAESGCRVIIPVLISRSMDRQRSLSNREFIYRPAYELGRHVIGYEIQKVLAAIDWMAAQSSNSA